MASPQAENGHLDLANEIIEKLCQYRIPGEQMQIIWVVLRHTWCWHKKEVAISLSTFVKETGLNRKNVARAINALVAKKLLASGKSATSHLGECTNYRFNKDYDKWTASGKKATSLVAILPQEPVKPSGNIATHKRNIVFKEKNKYKREHLNPSTKSGTSHQFQDSFFFLFENFSLALSELGWSIEKIKYYYQAVKDYQELHPLKTYTNWIAAVRSWDRHHPDQWKKHEQARTRSSIV